MRNHYIAFDSDGIVRGVGKSRKEAKENGKDLRIEYCDEAAYQYFKDEGYLEADCLSPEFDARLQADLYYLSLPRLTVGQLKRFLKNFADDLEIFTWDRDTNAFKGCYQVCRNGRTIQLCVEPFGRKFIVDSMKAREA